MLLKGGACTVGTGGVDRDKLPALCRKLLEEQHGWGSAGEVMENASDAGKGCTGWARLVFFTNEPGTRSRLSSLTRNGAEFIIPEGVWVLALCGRHGHILIHGDDHLLLHLCEDHGVRPYQAPVPSLKIFLYYLEVKIDA